MNSKFTELKKWEDLAKLSSNKTEIINVVIHIVDDTCDTFLTEMQSSPVSKDLVE